MQTTREFKHLPYFAVKSADSGRIRTGICAVFGNVDHGKDRIHPGAFKKTIAEGQIRFKHLWNHEFHRPPTAQVLEVKEIGRDELPPEVLAYAPEATGGLMVKREYYKDEFSSMILERVDAGDAEMSFGYDVKQMDFTEEKSEGKEVRIRELKELQLMDTSDVTFGMNNATIAAMAKAYGESRPIGSIVQELQFATHNIKAGRRNNAQDSALIDQLHQISLDLGCEKCVALEHNEEKSSPTDDNAKSGEAESVTIADNSLLANELKLNDLRLSQLLRSE
jgi:HK97 family phage prohead protease